MICFDAFKFLESNRWDSEKTIEWNKFDGTIQEMQARWIKKNAFSEWSSAPGTFAFFRDFSDDPDFLSFLSVWFFEEQKHFLIQYEYLKRFRPDLTPTQQEIKNVNIKFDATENRYILLFLHHIEELQLANWYINLEKDLTEPVAKQIYVLLARDEVRHSKLFYDYCQKYLEKDWFGAADGYSKTALFLLRERHNKHPVCNTVNQNLGSMGRIEARVPDPEVSLPGWSEHVRNEDPKVLDNKILNSLGKLLGREFNSIKDVLQFRKELKKSLTTN